MAFQSIVSFLLLIYWLIPIISPSRQSPLSLEHSETRHCLSISLYLLNFKVEAQFHHIVTSLHFTVTTYHCVLCWTIDEGATVLERSPTLTPKLRSRSQIQEFPPPLFLAVAPAHPYLVCHVWRSDSASDRYRQLTGSAVAQKYQLTWSVLDSEVSWVYKCSIFGTVNVYLLILKCKSWS